LFLVQNRFRVFTSSKSATHCLNHKNKFNVIPDWILLYCTVIIYF
jgi:hypothetical protein